MYGFLPAAFQFGSASPANIIALESGTNSFECDERSNSPRLSYCFIHSTVTIFTVPYPDEYYEGNKEGTHGRLYYLILFFLFELVLKNMEISNKKKKKKIFEEEIDRVVFSPKRITVPVNDR